MPVQTLPATAEAFDQWVALPENAGRDYEFIAGAVREVVSNSFSSETAANILAEIRAYAKAHKLGRVTGADGGYWIAGERYIPDVAFMSFARQPKPSQDAYNPLPPDLVVEVMSPTDDPIEATTKIVNYLVEGCVVWQVNPWTEVVAIYENDHPVRQITAADTLDGGQVLPGFRLAVNTIFPQSAE